MKKWATRPNYGFTLVELLIVIVVIAILAAISIVAYNGIQERAHASKAAAAASTYAKAIKMYITEGGVLAPNVRTCLGSQSQYPATGNFLAGECYVETENGSRWGPGFRVEHDSALATKFDAYLSTLPDVDFPAVNYRYNNGIGYDTRGIFYNGSNRVVYILNGEKDCPDSNYDDDANVTYCYLRVK